jgi:hypothetical protein
MSLKPSLTEGFLIVKIKTWKTWKIMQNSLNGYFNLLRKNDEYIKTRHLINHTTGNVDPEILKSSKTSVPF